MFELFPAAMRATIFVHDNQQPSANSRQPTTNRQRATRTTCNLQHWQLATSNQQLATSGCHKIEPEPKTWPKRAATKWTDGRQTAELVAAATKCCDVSRRRRRRMQMGLGYTMA